MRHPVLRAALALCILMLCAQALAQGGVVLQNGTLWSPELDKPAVGTVILGADGKIEAVGPKLPAPAGYTVVDASGKVITPGFIDAYTSLGLVEIGAVRNTVDDNLGGEDPIRAAFRVEDGFNPNSAVIPVQRSGGVTSAVIVPSGGLVAGQGSWVWLGAPAGVQAHAELRRGPVAMYMAMDEVGGGAVGGSRAGAALRLREFLDDARYYKANKKKFEENRSRPLAASRLDLEAVLPALEGKVPVVFYVDRAADIRGVLALSREWGIKPIIRGGGEAWMLRQELAREGVPVILHSMSNLPGSFAFLGARADNAALLAEAGVPVVLSVFDSFNVRNLRQMAANAIRAGMDPQQALRAVTLHPARAFGMDKELGSLEVGKRADVVLWSGEPFAVASRVERMYIGGQEISLRSRQDALFEKYRSLPRRAPIFQPEE